MFQWQMQRHLPDHHVRHLQDLGQLALQLHLDRRNFEMEGPRQHVEVTVVNILLVVTCLHRPLPVDEVASTRHIEAEAVVHHHHMAGSTKLLLDPHQDRHLVQEDLILHLHHFAKTRPRQAEHIHARNALLQTERLFPKDHVTHLQVLASLQIHIWLDCHRSLKVDKSYQSSTIAQGQRDSKTKLRGSEESLRRSRLVSERVCASGRGWSERVSRLPFERLSLTRVCARWREKLTVELLFSEKRLGINIITTPDLPATRGVVNCWRVTEDLERKARNEVGL